MGYVDLEKKRAKDRDWYNRHKNDPEFKARKTARNKRWASNNKEYSRKYYKTYHYGISYEDFLNLVEQQEGKCAICGIFFGEGLYVDHNHETGVVRGLLCSNCNTGIGMLQDSILILLKAMEYLNKPS
jgi:hypothetical protein